MFRENYSSERQVSKVDCWSSLAAPHTLSPLSLTLIEVRGAPRLGCAADEGVTGPDVGGNVAGRRVPKDGRAPRDGDGRLRKLPNPFKRNFDIRPPDRVEGSDPEQGAN